MQFLHLSIQSAVEGLLGGLDQWEGPVVARAPEVVVVDGPEHDAAETLLAHVHRLVLHGRQIVVADPLVSLVRVGPHLPGVLPHDVPVILVDGLADLVIRQVTVLSRAFALKFNELVINTLHFDTK